MAEVVSVHTSERHAYWEAVKLWFAWNALAPPPLPLPPPPQNQNQHPSTSKDESDKLQKPVAAAAPPPLPLPLPHTTNFDRLKQLLPPPCATPRLTYPDRRLSLEVLLRSRTLSADQYTELGLNSSVWCEQVLSRFDPSTDELCRVLAAGYVALSAAAVASRAARNPRFGARMGDEMYIEVSEMEVHNCD